MYKGSSLGSSIAGSLLMLASLNPSIADTGLIDDFTRADGLSALGTPWRAVTDQVMGGRSEGAIRRRVLDGRQALCLAGDVSLANNGGFVQAMLDLTPPGGPESGLDASGAKQTTLAEAGTFRSLSRANRMFATKSLICD